MPVGRGGEERVGSEAAAGVNGGTVVTGGEGEAGGKLKTCMEGRLGAWDAGRALRDVRAGVQWSGRMVRREAGGRTEMVVEMSGRLGGGRIGPR